MTHYFIRYIGSRILLTILVSSERPIAMYLLFLANISIWNSLPAGAIVTRARQVLPAMQPSGEPRHFFDLPQAL